MTFGQISFEGREVHGVKLVFPGLGEMDWTMEEGEELPTTGDEIEITVRCKVIVRPGEESYDKTGTATSQLTRKMYLKPTYKGFNAVVTGRRAEEDVA